MKLKCLPLSRVWIYVVSLALPGLPATQAASLYWDGTSTGADADGGAGTWSTAGDPANWDSSAVAGGDLPWTDGSDAVFGATGGVVTVSGTVSATSLGFTTPGYSLTGGQLTLTGIPVIDTAGNDVTLGSLVAGSVPVSKTGTGTLTLSGANTFKGAFTIAAGTVKAGNSAAFGAGAWTGGGGTTVSSGATLDVNGQNLSSESITISGTGVGGAGAIVNTGASSTNAFDYIGLAGPATVGGTVRFDIRGSSSSINMGGHTLTKTGPNDFRMVSTLLRAPGNIDVKQGSVWFELQSNIGGLPTNVITIRNGASLGLSGNDYLDHRWTVAFESNTLWQTTNACRWNGPVTLAGATTFEAATNASMTNFGPISGAGSVVKTGLGFWTLKQPNTYTGGTTVNAGKLTLSSSGGGVGIGTLRGEVSVNAEGTLALATANALGTAPGVRVSPLNVNGGLVDNLNSVNNTFAVLNLTAGRLRSGGGLNSPTIISYYNLAGDSVVNSLAASTPSLIAGRLHLGTGNTGNQSKFDVEDGPTAEDLRIDAAITEANEGYGITKDGPGLLALNGPCLFTGETKVQEGTLLLAAAGSLTESPVVVESGARFGTTAAGKSVASLTVSSGSSLILPAQAGATTVVAGALDLAGGNIGICPLIGGDMPAGTYDLLVAGEIIGTGTPVLDMTTVFGPTRVTGSVIVNGNKIQLILTGTGEDLVWNNASASGAAIGTWNTTLANFTDGAVNESFQAFDSVTFDDSVAPGSAKTIALGTAIAPARVAVDNSNGNYTFSSTGSLAGAGSLVKTGSSSLTVAGPYSYSMSGHITAGGGILDFAGKSISASGLTLSSGAALNNATVVVGPMDLQSGSVNATLQGSGAWEKTTAGTVTLSANNKLAGPGSIAAGHLIIGNTTTPNTSGTLGTGPVAISAGSSVTISRSDNAPIIANTFSGSGSLNLLGANSSTKSTSNFTFSGDISAFSGPITATNAMISMSTSKGLGSGPITLSGYAGLSASDITVPNAISLTTNGAWGGDGLILANATLSGPITLPGSASIFLTSSATGGSQNIISGPIGESGGPASLGISSSYPGNTFTLAGASTHTGITSIGGRAIVNLTGSLGASAVTVGGFSTLGGNGVIGSGGSLTFGNLGVLKVATSGGALTVNGDVNLGPNVTVAVEVTRTPVMGGPVPVLHYTGTLTGGAGQLNIDALSLYRKADFAFSPGLITLDIGTKSLVWKGSAGNRWETGGSARWSTTDAGPATDFFFKGDSVTFNDSSPGGWVSGSGFSVQPSAVLVDNNTSNYNISTTFDGPCALTKNGSGTLFLSGSNSYTGGTIVNGGRLEVTTSSLGSGPVSVAAGATLAGDATIPGPVTIAGTLDPGLSSQTWPSVMSTGPTTLSGNYACQLDMNSSDRLAVTGNLDITGSTLTLNKTGYGLTTYTIATYTGTLTGTFSSVTGMPPGYLLKYDAAGKKIIVTRITFADWAADFPGLVDPMPGADPDEDGVVNLVEYVLAGNPAAKDSTILPTQTLSETELLFRYKRSDISLYNTVQTVQWSPDLSTWTDIPVTASNSPDVEVTFNGDAPDDVTVTIPRIAGSMYVRLKVTQP